MQEADPQACCACLSVVYKPVDNGDGTVTPRWVCDQSDEHVFVPAAETRQAIEQVLLRYTMEAGPSPWPDVDVDFDNKLIAAALWGYLDY